MRGTVARAWSPRWASSVGGTRQSTTVMPSVRAASSRAVRGSSPLTKRAATPWGLSPGPVPKMDRGMGRSSPEPSAVRASAARAPRWVTQARPGTAGSAVALVRRFQRRIYGLALTIVGDPATAEDVAQETFARAWRHAAAYDARRASVATWLLTIARNLSIDAVRLRRPEPLNPEALAALSLADRAQDPADQAVRESERSRVQGALARLPAEQRRALVLAAIGGRTAQGICEAEGGPPGAAPTTSR